ncbi:MAG: PEGA domain-containing protein [Alphaproteobacteria bacterium]|nr:PEGA domain-containing protein [Alphaproteobacteria bacterium]
MIRLNKLRAVVLAAVFFAAQAAFGAQTWTTSTPKADSNYKYYVGRGEADSEKAAFDQAVKDAYDQAARENFPAEYSYQADIYQTENSAYLTERTVVSGISARFDGFEKEDEFIRKTGEGYSVKLLYRFSKKAIAQEKERLKKIADTPRKRQMSVVGSKSDAGKGILIVETDPVDGAAVYVDGDRYGQTPMTLYGSLSAGRHSLRIDHPRYQTVNENIITVPGKTVRVKKTLLPAFATISVTTDPVNADVYLDGRPVGTAPLTYDRIPVEEEITISLRHEEMERMSVPVTLKKGEVRPMNIVLPEKSAKISIFSFPQNAEVFIDKRRVGLTPVRNYPIARGSHTYTVEKEGYEPVTRSFAAKGGEILSETAELKALVREQTVVSKNKSAVVAGGVDKFHRYEEIRPPKKHLNLSSAATGEEVLLAAMKWSYPSNFIRARASYVKRKAGGTLFFVFLSFDEDNYQDLFVKPLRRALKNVSDSSRAVTKNPDCFYEDKKEGQISCSFSPAKSVSDTVFVKTSPVRHGFFKDKADFDTFVLMTQEDGRRERIKPYEKRELILSIYDRSGKKHRIGNADLYVAKFTTDKNRNVVFMPWFNDGYESLVQAFQIPDWEPSDVSRVIIQVTQGKPADDPYPPRKKKKL